MAAATGLLSAPADAASGRDRAVHVQQQGALAWSGTRVTPAARIGWGLLDAYTEPVAALPPLTGGATVSRGWAGVKVGLVQRRLGMGSRWESYDAATESAVAGFQRRAGLPATGRVDQRTWAALNIGYPWTVDAWRTMVRQPLTATPAQRVEQMIWFAEANTGSDYTWGGAGPGQLGFDCSGLVLQALHSAGLDLTPITVMRHQQPGFRTAAAIYDAPMRHLPVGQRRRGDLLFWSDSRGHITHMAIYLGEGRIVESSVSGGGVATRGMRPSTASLRTMPDAVRPFG
ncbi:MAG: hypothetical protein CSA58_03250 [Micrococcales bacterium]|nr:MAG: hypothetical protein CSA58_03250 [Micrococcales bacterium]